MVQRGRWNSTAKLIFLIVLHNLQITATPMLFIRSDKGVERVDHPSPGSCPLRRKKSGKSNWDRDKVPQVPTHTSTNKLYIQYKVQTYSIEHLRGANPLSDKVIVGDLLHNR